MGIENTYKIYGGLNFFTGHYYMKWRYKVVKLQIGKKSLKNSSKGKLTFIIGIIVGIFLYFFFGETVIKYISELF